MNKQCVTLNIYGSLSPRNSTNKHNLRNDEGTSTVLLSAKDNGGFWIIVILVIITIMMYGLLEVENIGEETTLTGAQQQGVTVVSNADADAVGTNPCTWGPAFWCANVTNAKKCNFDYRKCSLFEELRSGR